MTTPSHSTSTPTVAPTRLAIVGPAGRMGAALVALAQADAHAEVVAQVMPADRALWPAGGFPGGVTLAEVDPSGVDVLIDFSHREAVAAHAAWCGQHGVAWVLGTTGLTAADDAAVAAAAERCVVFQASNFSLGVALLTDLAARAARILGLEADIEVVESHHHHKRDAPSGTALSLARAVAEARGQDLDAVVTHGRSGLVGERPVGEIGMHALRLGDIVGHHELHFAWGHESVVLTHDARDRGVFAQGAIRAAHWCAQQRQRGEVGPRGMTDLVG